MKKNKFVVLILIIAIIAIIPLTVNAVDNYQINPGNYKSDEPGAAEVKDMYIFGGSVAGAIHIIGTIASIGTMIIIGIRYMLGSVDEKAEYRERMLPYLIGAVLLFGASNIVNIVYNIANTNKSYDHADENWQGKMYTVECQNKIKIGPVTKECGKQISIPIPEENDVECSNCGAVLYKAHYEEPTSKAKVLSITEK